jgi:hypothetical protein
VNEEQLRAATFAALVIVMLANVVAAVAGDVPKSVERVS